MRFTELDFSKREPPREAQWLADLKHTRQQLRPGHSSCLIIHGTSISVIMLVSSLRNLQYQETCNILESRVFLNLLLSPNHGLGMPTQSGRSSVGQKNRTVGATALNDRSSRSHSCLTVHVQGRDLTSRTILHGCMHLVDLAGSERVDESEGQHINKSPSTLGDVISSLAQKNSHIPYKNCKLPQLLQDSLGAQAKTLMFVHISPELDAIGETISTLKFAERVSTVELGAAYVNKNSAGVKELKEQIASHKAALARKEGQVEPMQQQKVSSSPCSTVSSPYHPRPQNGDILADQKSDSNICRKNKCTK
ncbi:hypothetical protein HYC85_024597 [Camellia sinensis]|uniref:Kinesin motor domain-containing protein n=1 Tax=Camellia sinensis TaxID=4442 RepID=A0A7J7GAZ2_CAMSI|nr:hypothetical protein HYC85_024597 [Camellia sinensis]